MFSNAIVPRSWYSNIFFCNSVIFHILPSSYFNKFPYFRYIIRAAHFELQVEYIFRTNRENEKCISMNVFHEGYFNVNFLFINNVRFTFQNIPLFCSIEISIKNAIAKLLMRNHLFRYALRVHFLRSTVSSNSRRIGRIKNKRYGN